MSIRTLLSIIGYCIVLSSEVQAIPEQKNVSTTRAAIEAIRT